MRKQISKLTIQNQLEQIASEICDRYCKWPDQYFQTNENEDIRTEKLVEEKCMMCPLVQFLSE